MSLFQFSVLFGFIIIILEMGFIQHRIDKSRWELESIYHAIDAIKDLLESEKYKDLKDGDSAEEVIEDNEESP